MGWIPLYLHLELYYRMLKVGKHVPPFFMYYILHSLALRPEWTPKVLTLEMTTVTDDILYDKL